MSGCCLRIGALEGFRSAGFRGSFFASSETLQIEIRNRQAAKFKMLILLLHRIAAQPWIYDRIQQIVGQRELLLRVLPGIKQLRPGAVLDVGGGTGDSRGMWPEGCHYVCLDNEMPKLRGFRRKAPSGSAVLSDATRMAIPDKSMEGVMCK